MMSSGQATPYHDGMGDDMDCNSMVGDSIPELSYEMVQEKELCVSKVADQQEPMRPMGGNSEATPTRASNEESVINVQLPYNPNAPTEPELWSGSFHPISLHGSIKQIALNAKNIKVTLDFMAKYITNKQVNSSYANDLKEFDGMGNAIWKFISSVYEAKWDSLYTDNRTNTLRSKISGKFTLRSTPIKNNNKEKNHTPIPVSIEKAPPLPPLPAKTKSKVNRISKYFKLTNNKPNMEKPTKSYTQASRQSPSTSNVLKIKESFLALNANQIDRVNNIVKGNPKPKLRIQMTTKGPSRKQIIVPISSNNSVTFLKNSSAYVSNLNRLLGNAKTEVKVDFIRLDPIGLVITTNKVTVQSDLQIIDQYVKKSDNINKLQVKEPHLPQSKSYLKITGILYFPNGKSQERLNVSDVESALKQNHIFNDIKLVSKPRIIKVSPKSDMSIIWIDI